MTLGHKSLKPLRFLKYSLAIGLGGMLFAGSAGAEDSGQKKCVNEFARQLKSFTKLDVSKLDEAKLCAANENAKNNDAPAFDQRKKLKLSQGEEIGTSFPGACHSSYEAVSLVYERLLKAREETCAKIFSEIEEKFPNCLDSKPPESCKTHLDAMVQVYSDGKRNLKKDIEKSIEFLKDYREWNGKAEEKFKKDLDQLQRIRNEQVILGVTVAPPQVLQPINSSDQGSASLKVYLEKLEKIGKHPANSRVSAAGEANTSPIYEQGEAKKLVSALAAKLKTLKNQEEQGSDAQLAAFREGLRRNLDSASGGDGYIKKITDVAPTLAPVAGSLLTNTGNPASTIASGSTGALPALALVGAAGAAGIAMGQKNTGSSGLGSSTGGIEGPVMTPNNKAEGTEFGGKENAQAPAPLPGSPLGPNGNDTAEKAVEGDTAVASNGAMAAALGGGASVMPGKSKNNREVASASPSAAPGGDEALKTFGGELRPSPRPSASPDSAGNDVSNLLGKMKDLFNMDDSFGGGGMPPPDMSSGGPVYPANGGSAGGDDYNGEEYAGGDDYQAEGEYQGGAEEAYQGSNPMGDIEVTLFRRVHARHVKCMEKGLVLLMSQELPE
jgi:hypothetical protein